jgi:hypothetical protein
MVDFRAFDISTLISAAFAAPALKNARLETPAATAIAATILMASSGIVVVIVVVKTKRGL